MQKESFRGANLSLSSSKGILFLPMATDICALRLGLCLWRSRCSVHRAVLLASLLEGWASSGLMDTPRGLNGFLNSLVVIFHRPPVHLHATNRTTRHAIGRECSRVSSWLRLLDSTVRTSGGGELLLSLLALLMLCMVPLLALFILCMELFHCDVHSLVASQKSACAYGNVGSSFAPFHLLQSALSGISRQGHLSGVGSSFAWPSRNEPPSFIASATRRVKISAN